jgi:hypothetical protein
MQITEGGFKQFLVETPLLACSFPHHNGVGFGTFHQQYWIDGTPPLLCELPLEEGAPVLDSW